MAIIIHPHADQRLRERGATRAEVVRAVADGSKKAAKHGRTEFILRFAYNRKWLGELYSIKQVHVFAARKGSNDWLAVTVIVKFIR